MPSKVIEIVDVDNAVKALKSQCARADHPLRNSRQVFGLTVLDSEGERHRYAKRSWATEFSQRNLSECFGEMVRNVVKDGFAYAQEKNDLFLACEYIPHKVALSILGVEDIDPLEHSRAIKPISDYLEYSIRGDALKRAKEYLADPVFLKNHDLFSTLNEAERQKEIALFLVAGTETTVIAMEILLCEWMADSDMLRRSVESLGLEGAIMHVLVQDSPLGSVTRFCADSVELGEHEWKKGDIIKVDICAAHKQALGGTISGQETRHLTHNLVFGAGRHVCPGKRLAMMELELFLKMLLELPPSAYESFMEDQGATRPSTFRHPCARRIQRRE